MDKIYYTLLKELKKCKKSKDVPVSALLINQENKIVAKDFNTRQKKYNFTNHAEVGVINKIYKKFRTKNLSEYILVTSLKPCLMCLTIIEEANIKKVFYYLDNLKCNYKKLKTDILFEKFGTINQQKEFNIQLKEFFLKLRK
ncbi:nucleoside deaminase [Spiroplasma monobiae]|uniref:tRNA-specific adenosine deaminase n=1 Tax=Spiroplasma monobiae MQ-1 TaxID=1336748 RepID=A0A2K9LT44_SPISQ|nr:nucleoside deaminase [Spiroplasma monobiae]AUM62259.1 tRNA-specific adenosine deaminase [Spiroplasma monobiae MQ-1]